MSAIVDAQNNRIDPLPITAFRFAFFAALALHTWPTLACWQDNYSRHAFRTQDWNAWLFELFATMPQWTCALIAAAFVASVILGALGISLRASAIVSALSLYALASFNSINLQTLALSLAWTVLGTFALLGTDDAGGVPLWKARKHVAKVDGVCATTIGNILLLGVFFAGVEKLSAGWTFTDPMATLFSYPPGHLVRDWALSAFGKNHTIGKALTWLTLIAEIVLPALALVGVAKKANTVALLIFFVGIALMLQVPPLFWITYCSGLPLLLGPSRTAPAPSPAFR